MNKNYLNLFSFSTKMSWVDLNLNGLIFLFGLPYCLCFYLLLTFILNFSLYLSVNSSLIIFFYRNTECLVAGLSYRLNYNKATSPSSLLDILFLSEDSRDYPLVVDLILKLRFWFWVFIYFLYVLTGSICRPKVFISSVLKWNYLNNDSFPLFLCRNAQWFFLILWIWSRQSQVHLMDFLFESSNRWYTFRLSLIHI